MTRQEALFGLDVARPNTKPSTSGRKVCAGCGGRVPPKSELCARCRRLGIRHHALDLDATQEPEAIADTDRTPTPAIAPTDDTPPEGLGRLMMRASGDHTSPQGRRGDDRTNHAARCPGVLMRAAWPPGAPASCNVCDWSPDR